MNEINLVFPHQLFSESPLIDNDFPVYILEEHLFFTQFKFHKQKLVFHRASMKAYESYLIENKKQHVTYVEDVDIRDYVQELKASRIGRIHVVDVTDDWLERRLKKQASFHEIEIVTHESSLFLNSKEEEQKFFRVDKKSYFQTSFYKSERKKRAILLDDEGQPTGGKWSFDAENRKKYPRNKIAPGVQFPKTNKFVEEAKTYVNQKFPDHLGEVSNSFIYPTTYVESEAWFEAFLQNRFSEFGTYEDAIMKDESILNHSVLTPMLNVGLLSVSDIVERSLSYASEHDIPINSVEGFIRQLIGWREFMRKMYEARGREQRTTNYWGFNRKIPDSFYTATTGIVPIDRTIRKVLKTGYCHHIERLMILGSFMLLCEFDPDEVYRWFMELFIDAYDWVMVPNVYGMSQFADGGLLSTKPYISGSNYVMKMSDYKKGEWQKTWDGLFWRFMHVHRDFFLKNPRLGMLVRTWDKMSEEKKQTHLNAADEFLSQLDQALV